MTKSLLKTTLTAALTAGTLATSALTASAETLKFVSWQVDDGGMGDWWKAAIAKFEEEHPDVSIEFTKVERASYADTMTTLFAGGQPPHIVHLASFEYQNFAENGWMENLDPWLEERRHQHGRLGRPRHLSLERRDGLRHAALFRFHDGLQSGHSGRSRRRGANQL